MVIRMNKLIDGLFDADNRLQNHFDKTIASQITLREVLELYIWGKLFPDDNIFSIE